MIVEALLNQFFTCMKNVLPLLLQDTDASEDTMTGLEGLANSIRRFDATLSDPLKQLIDRLRVWLNLLIIMRADFEALVEQTTAKLKVAKLKVARTLELQDLER